MGLGPRPVAPLPCMRQVVEILNSGLHSTGPHMPQPIQSICRPLPVLTHSTPHEPLTQACPTHTHQLGSRVGSRPVCIWPRNWPCLCLTLCRGGGGGYSLERTAHMRALSPAEEDTGGLRSGAAAGGGQPDSRIGSKTSMSRSENEQRCNFIRSGNQSKVNIGIIDFICLGSGDLKVT